MRSPLASRSFVSFHSLSLLFFHSLFYFILLTLTHSLVQRKKVGRKLDIFVFVIFIFTCLLFILFSPFFLYFNLPQLVFFLLPTLKYPPSLDLKPYISLVFILAAFFPPQFSVKLPLLNIRLTPKS